MRAYASYDGKAWLVLVCQPSRRKPETVVEVVKRCKTPRAAVEEAARWNASHGQA